MISKGAARSLVAVYGTLVWSILAAPVLAEARLSQPWTLEYFGEDVTVLRWRSEDGADILLSCEGRDHRLRLRLPEKIADRLGGVKHGWILVRTSKAREPDRAFVVAPYRISGGRMLTVTEVDHAARGAIVSIGGMLATQSDGLDVLIRSGARPITLDRLITYRLLLPQGNDEPITFRGFADACLRRGSKDTRREK